jgi:nitroreductase
MEFEQLVKDRYSVRSFLDKEVEQEKIEKIVEAAHISPSAKNLQPVRIFVIKDPLIKQEFAKVCRCTFNAPVIIITAYDISKSWHSHLMEGYQSGETDASIVTTTMMLMAHNLGLGSCWVGLFNKDDISKILNLDNNLIVTSLLPIGYPSKESTPSVNHNNKIDIKEMVKYL